ncbi:MAG: type VI secretion system ATPase TssH, partial [Planctomycetes bacterium]|nr:type VI secretion system ATPase TssH [Planctomycetota bacterium]
MDLNRFTEKVQEALDGAQRKAASGGQQNIDVIHLLVSLLEQEPGLAVSVLRKAGVEVGGLKQRAEQELGRLPKVAGVSGGPEQVSLSGGLNRLLARAEDEAKRFKDDFISIEHVLLALTDDGGTTGRLLKEFGVTRQRLMSALQEVRGHQRVTSQNPEATYEALERYGRELTQLATRGKLDPVIGRDEEIRRVVQVLSRR